VPAYTSKLATAVEVLAPAAPPVAGTDTVVSLAGAPGKGWHLAQVVLSYSGDPLGGRLVIAWEDPGAGPVAESFDVTQAGLQSLVFSPPRRFPVNTTVVLTLTAGGPGVTGTLSPSAWPE
jgi:hypothetical protein